MDTKTTYDPGRALTYGALFGVLVLTLFICIIIGWQVYMGVQVSTEFVGALTFIMGWLTGQAGQIFNNRFGSTAGSAAKDVTIAQQARTAAAQTDALLDPTVVVTKTDGKPLGRAMMAEPGAPTPTGAPLQTDNLTVNALNADVREVDPAKGKGP